jgi:arabinan endo-1,5-alpha-L-arabinosidase
LPDFSSNFTSNTILPVKNPVQFLHLRSLFQVLLVPGILICAVVKAQPAGNPLKGDLRVHDPVMIKQDGRYYIFHTGRGISIKTSEDRVEWKNAGRVFPAGQLPVWHREDIPGQDGNLWAPDIHYRDGLYHLYYSVSAWMNFNSSIGYATNITLDPDDPQYRWVDHGKVISYKNGGEGVNVIDPMVFTDDDGRVWLFYGSYQAGLRMTELDPETGHLISDPPQLTVISPALGEGVFIIEDTAYHYIFASRGICCRGLESNYQIVMGRAEDVHGPYLNREGESWLDNRYTLFLEGDYEEPGRGHNGFFYENDTTFIVYHAYTRSAGGAPILNIKPLYMDTEGWPAPDPTGNLFKMKNPPEMP